MPRLFDYYIFADYSGSKDEKTQKKSIALAVFDGKKFINEQVKGYTRESLYEAVFDYLTCTNRLGKRVIIGFDHGFVERRLVEEKCRQMKPFFKIYTPGAVGQQSLLGIPYLAKLRRDCKAQNIPLFCWPFDGFELPNSAHVLVEIYPKLHNLGKKTDEDDAKETAKWLAAQDSAGALGDWFSLELNEDEKQRVLLEGWVIGVK